VKTGTQRILTILKNWIPACAGMTDYGLFRLLTKTSSMLFKDDQTPLYCCKDNNGGRVCQDREYGPEDLKTLVISTYYNIEKQTPLEIPVPL
jgi:hypothetical protein